MPRPRQVPRSDAKAKIVHPMCDRLLGPERCPVAEPGTAAGTPGDWWTVFALVPDVLEHPVGGFALYRSPQRFSRPERRQGGSSGSGHQRARVPGRSRAGS